MSVQKNSYEALLAEWSDPLCAITLLKQHRPYLEIVPSMRRPQDSLISIPLPIVRVRQPVNSTATGATTLASGQAVCLPCDVALLMCEPEWKIKMGIEILIFLHRPREDFSDLLRRWRLTQVWLDGGYEWFMPAKYSYIFGEGGEKICPLFVLFEETPPRLQKGLQGAGLPYIVHQDATAEDAETVLDSAPSSL